MPISHDRHVVDLNFCSISLYHDCISDLLEQTCNMSDNINKVVTTARPTRGQGGGAGGGKITGARSAQRCPEISVKFSYRLSSLLNEIHLLAHYPLIVVIDRKTYQM
jgi:hypothetical protein